MKQHITLDQIKELSQKGKYNYKKIKSSFGWFDSEMVWLNDNVYFLNIGQMLCILNKQSEKIREHWLDYVTESSQDAVSPNYKGELCDALWLHVKEILENG